MKISRKDLKAIGKTLDKRQPLKLADDIAQDLSLKEIVTSLAPQLASMKRRGFTTDEMVTALKENKISIDGKTLNRYLNDYRATGQEPVSDAAAKPKKAKSPRGKDGSTPGEETPSDQSDPAVATAPAPFKDSLTPDKNTSSGQPRPPVSMKADSIPDRLKDLI